MGIIQKNYVIVKIDPWWGHGNIHQWYYVNNIRENPKLTEDVKLFPSRKAAEEAIHRRYFRMITWQRDGSRKDMRWSKLTPEEKIGYMKNFEFIPITVTVEGEI